MPGASTDIQNRCFLAYNEVGMIVRRLEGDESVIEVEFMDSTRKRIAFRDESTINTGSISNSGAVLGGVYEEESGRQSGYFNYFL